MNAASQPGKRAFLHFCLPDEAAAFRSSSEVALALCRRHTVSATFFLRSIDLEDRDKLEAARAIVAAGHAIGSRGATGGGLAGLDRAQMEDEVARSREQISRTLGVDCAGFYSPALLTFEALRQIEAAGYRFDCSVECTYQAKRCLEMERVFPEPFRPFPEGELVELPLSLTPSAVSVARIRRTAKRLDYLSLVLTGRHCSSRGRSADALVAAAAEHFVFVDAGEFAGNWPRSAPDLNPRVVLGISTTHETGAAIVRDGRVLAAVSEERLSRVKQDVSYPPVRSIEEVIRIAGVPPKDIEAVAIAGLHWKDLLPQMLDGFLRDVRTYDGVADYLIHLCRLPYRVFYLWRALGYRSVIEHLDRRYGVRPKVFYIEHHEAHASSAHRTSGAETSLVVTADGVGDDLSMTVSFAKASAIRRLYRSFYPNSLGHFYTACTQLLGFKGGQHEGKITGLAAYGERQEPLLALVRSTLKTNGSFKLNKRYYSEGIVRGIRPRRMLERGLGLETVRWHLYKPGLRRLLARGGWRREDVAFAYQRILEEEMTRIVEEIGRSVGQPRDLCLAGGVFANVRLNQALGKAAGVESIFVFPGMGDGGLCVGAALSIVAAPSPAMEHVYLGPKYSDTDVASALDGWRSRIEERAYGVTGFVLEEARLIARALAEEAVVARFAGAMEFGPRALGNRSILCQAKDPTVNQWLNQRLNRTEFMPFAPMCLWEDAEEYFYVRDGEKRACEFMTYAVDCKERMIRECPAAVHVDGTARPQLVRREINPRMHSILLAYRDLTGVSCVVNTSFNMHEEPIVCSPEDALRVFLDAKLEVLFLESRIVANTDRFEWLFSEATRRG